MEIVVCVRPVPEPETRLRATADGRAFDPEGVKFLLAGYDESAVEQALLLKEAHPASAVHAIACGPAPRSEEALRAALALGADRATWVESSADVAGDPPRAARAIAAALAGTPFDLVLCGKQAGDDESGLFAGALGEALGVPDVGYVVDLRWSAADRRFVFQRAIESGTERWDAPAPLVVALQQAWNDPRTAKLPNILKSRRATIAKVAAAAAPAAGWAAERFELPPPRTGARPIEYKTPEEAAQQLVRILREEAKVLP
ncbi:Electron transfer flavoprotein, beta subunit [mine drainage metagenome]|uniref:Electron transfer flavoprotein, beta subunit n=1 Tax=mine drainage metagenome TaxID=410659 RepID=T0ZZ12_9ZZZZ